MKFLALTPALPFLVSGLILPHLEPDQWQQLRVGHATFQHEATSWSMNLAWNTLANAFGWAKLDVLDKIEEVSRGDDESETVWQYISSSKE